MRCKSYARTTGEQCRNAPVTGYEVCRMHGANKENTGGAPEGNGNAVTHGAYETLMRERLPEEERAAFDAVTVDPSLQAALRIVRYKILRLIGAIDVNVHGKDSTWQVKADDIEKGRALAYLVDAERKLVKEMQGGGEDDPLAAMVRDWEEGMRSEGALEDGPKP